MSPDGVLAPMVALLVDSVAAASNGAACGFEVNRPCTVGGTASHQVNRTARLIQGKTCVEHRLIRESRGYYGQKTRQLEYPGVLSIG